MVMALDKKNREYFIKNWRPILEEFIDELRPRNYVWY